MEKLHVKTGIGEEALLNKDKAFLIATADVLMEEIIAISTIITAHNVDMNVVSERLMVHCINFACTQQAAHGLMKLIATCFDETEELIQSPSTRELIPRVLARSAIHLGRLRDGDNTHNIVSAMVDDFIERKDEIESNEQVGDCIRITCECEVCQGVLHCTGDNVQVGENENPFLPVIQKTLDKINAKFR
jgi:hypothetical protein